MRPTRSRPRRAYGALAVEACGAVAAPSAAAAALEAAIGGRGATVGVIGLGYVGLPLALAAAAGGFRVLGFDVDAARVEELAGGVASLVHVEGESLRRELAAGRFSATADLGRLGEPDVLVLCVPTPLTPEREPDLRYVAATAESVGRCLRRGQLVVLESTTYPGTTAELVQPLLARSGLLAGEDYFLAYAPERVDPGGSAPPAAIPRVVGADDPASRRVAAAFYGQLAPRVVEVSSSRAAEATKLYENVFRAVNIALANEMKIVYERMGIDIWEVLDAAASKPFGFMRFEPGPGWGGHCIPVDPFYLAWKARAHGATARFVELAGEVNARMPEYVVERLARALNRQGKPLRGSRVLLLGLAYKAEVEDVRESPALEIFAQLVELGATVAYHDPYVPRIPPTRRFASLAGIASTPLDDAGLASQDAVVVVTAHRAVDYQRVLSRAALVVDTRGVYRGAPGVVPA